MQWLCLARLFSLLSLSIVASAAPQLRAGHSLLDVSRQADTAYDWDYHDGGKDWQAASCINNNKQMQSPVNISTTVAAKPADDDTFFFSYPSHEAPVKMINDGRFLYTNFDNADGKIGGFALGLSYPDHLTDNYLIYKMVIHTPSEHTYDGKIVPLELQLFHHKKDCQMKSNGEPSSSDQAVVAVGFKESRDEASPFLRSLIDGGLPDQRGGTTLVNRAYPSALKFSELFKPVFGAQGEQAGFWDYTGSSTQPPCSAGVRWFVKQQPLNAKRKTLKYFTDVVTKSSHGVQGNNRALQTMGTRPVFPRFARNAVHMTVFDPAEPAAFTDAFNRVKEHQKTFKDALNGGAGGSAKAIADGKSANGVLMASRDYSQCMKMLGSVVEDASIARNKATSECNTMKGAQKTVENLAGGPARLEAANKFASAKKSCQDQNHVLKALSGQQEQQQARCDEIKSKITAKQTDAAVAKANTAKK